MSFTVKDIEDARERIKDDIIHTPLIRLENLDYYLGCQVYLKLENLQRTGSFKYRGAINKIKSLDKGQMAKGIVCASSGNHGKAIAYAARELAIPTLVVIPETAPKIKTQAIKDLGAEIITCKTSERFKIAEQISKDRGMALVPPFDDKEVMAGQGTIAYEILEDLPNPDYIVIPVSGGGLIGGISTLIKSKNDKIQVLGAEPKNAPAYSISLKEGQLTNVDTKATIADALPASAPGQINFPIVRDNVDRIIDVEEENILPAMKLLLTEGKILAEPSSAIGLAAVIQEDLNINREDRVCFIISGGSVSLDQLDMLKEL